ncbi:hypothetical protein GALMADRAFT_414486 [Galerina marginata CBS 339.88]|uniref:Uncharacterized protein n=1 Tax=Galerina marginata (strain CBS 339.88) TaxID=685588 RepID=A0A067TD76_GALM3|nr:hypothetical protein GALMADRAFT_414486 [Galerina marginata CBS 339.88]
MALSFRVHAQVTNLSDHFPGDVLPPPPSSRIVSVAHIKRTHLLERLGCRNTKTQS